MYSCRHSYFRRQTAVADRATRSPNYQRKNQGSIYASAIDHSSRVSIGKVKRVSCFTIVLNDQAKGISAACTSHGQVRRRPSGKTSFVEVLIMKARTIADSLFVSSCITLANRWTRRVDESAENACLVPCRRTDRLADDSGCDHRSWRVALLR